MTRPYHPPAPGAEVLTTRQACAALAVSRSTLWALIRAGRLHPSRLGPRTLRFDRAEVRGVLRARRTDARRSEAMRRIRDGRNLSEA